jgi:hypothetical protein
MSQIAPVITRETNMWRCWVGFNASHGMGLILFGLVFGFLALAHGQLLFQSPFLLIVGLAMLGGFVVLSKVYFFSVLFVDVSISLACYVASIALSRVLLIRS